MSTALMVLPTVWAVAAQAKKPDEVKAAVERRALASPLPTPLPTSLPTSLAFYRKYTEGLLHRYVRMSMEAGRAPSLLGKDLFRARVTNYVVHGFDDVVIFVHDVEQCLAKLGTQQFQLIERIALREYTQAETAAAMGLTPRTLVRRYREALDTLTNILLDRDLMEPMIASQGAGRARRRVKHCNI
jgi:hypothetical protein